MRSLNRLGAVIVTSVSIVACHEDAVTTPTSQSEVASLATSEAGKAFERRILMMDSCDSASFNAALGEGTCITAGQVTFAEFNEQFQRLGRVPQWRFSPAMVEVMLGDTYTAMNVGGESHTFTEVEEFGGGFVVPLNGGMPTVPECQGLAGSAFIPPGGTQSDTPEEAGTEKYQCCIHPWMRTTVRVRETGRTSH
jgi:plastocyanin